MSFRLSINGREVTNPATKALVGGAMVLLAMMIISLVALVVLPLVGITVAITAGTLLIVGGATLVLTIPLSFVAPRYFKFQLKRSSDDEKLRLK